MLKSLSIPGLSYLPNFLTPEEQIELINQIDSQTWLKDLRRRVQHYGYKYDYRARKIDSSLFLGEIPDWLIKIQHKMLDQKLIQSLFDQVIINDYLVSQGISKHIDCVPCFQNQVIILSLLEEWEMFFEKGEQKISFPLQSGSLLFLSNEARYEWTHEIPHRLIEPSGERTRRVSVTFRKVILE